MTVFPFKKSVLQPRRDFQSSLREDRGEENMALFRGAKIPAGPGQALWTSAKQLLAQIVQTGPATKKRRIYGESCGSAATTGASQTMQAFIANKNGFIPLPHAEVTTSQPTNLPPLLTLHLWVHDRRER